MTRGRSTHGNGKKWEEKDVHGLQSVHNKLRPDLQELNGGLSAERVTCRPAAIRVRSVLVCVSVHCIKYRLAVRTTRRAAI